MNLVDENNGTVCCVICNKWFGQITKNHIPERHIAHIKNLEMLPSKINYKKGSNCSISYESLLELIEKGNYDKNI